MIINDADWLSADDWYDQLVAQGYTEEYAARRAYGGPLAPDETPEEWAIEFAREMDWSLPTRLEMLYGPRE